MSPSMQGSLVLVATVLITSAAESESEAHSSIESFVGAYLQIKGAQLRHDALGFLKRNDTL